MSEPPELPGVKHDWIEIEGARIHVAEAGDPAGDAVLLLHGWPQNWYLWREVIPRLAEAGYRVLCPDLRGLGWSEAAGQTIPDQFARDQVALLDALGIERARVLGHDWGGFTALLLAVDHPDRFERAVACNVPHPWAEPSARLLLDSWRLWYALGNALVPARAARAWLAKWILTHGHGEMGAMPPEALEIYMQQFSSPATSRATGELYREYFRLVPAALRGAWEKKRIGAPTLILFGARDLYVTSLGLEPVPTDRGPLEIELVPDSGHFIVDEKPALVAERALAHFRTTERNRVGAA